MLGLYRLELQVTKCSDKLTTSGIWNSSAVKEKVKIAFDYFKANASRICIGFPWQASSKPDGGPWGAVTPVESLAEYLQDAFDAEVKKVALLMSSAANIPTMKPTNYCSEVTNPNLHYINA